MKHMTDNRAQRYRLAGWWTGVRLIDRFETHVREGPDRLALVSGGHSMTRLELWHAAGEAAEQIRSLVGPARRPIVIHLPNCTDWMVMFLAVLRSGHVPATTPVTTPEAHLRHIFELTRSALVVCDGEAGANRSADAVRRAAAAAACGPIAVAVPAGGGLAPDGPPTSPTVAAEVPEATAHLMFTSSTTGPPKAVSHSEDSLAALNMQFAERFDLDQGTPVFMPSPLGHSVGAIHGCRLSLFVGAPLILQDEWDAGAALELVARHRADFTAAATPFLLDLANAHWDASEPKLASMRSFLCGGAQVPPALVRRCRAELPNTFVTPLWGMTEGGLTTCVRASTESQIETTVGVGLPGLELRILDAEGALRNSGSGELVMRGPGVFNGYYGQPELYAAEIVGEGFFRTGDLARIDADGYVSITGRLKDLIIRGAVNISPVETENAIAAHPDVVGVAVIGWPDERLGERICAAVHALVPLDLGEVLAFCAEQGLPRRYWPERLVQVDGFPRTAAGKIRKQQLRDELVAAATSAETMLGSSAGPHRETSR